MSYKIVVLSLVMGMVVGGLFSYMDLPIPAPPNLAGVMGIVGLYIGFRLIEVLA